jgi:hypothetical protein
MRRLRRSRLDHEVQELLRDDPELLALAEVIASLRPEEMGSARARRRWLDRPRLRRLLRAVGRRRPA